MKKLTIILSVAVFAFGLTMVFGPLAVAQSPEGAAGRNRSHAAKPAKYLAQLDLTDAQKAQVRAIVQSTREQVQQVLTAEQQRAVRQQWGKAHRFRKAAPTLTEAQKAQLQEIRRHAQEKAKAITENAALSEEEKRAQRQALRQTVREQMRQVLPAERQGRAEKGKSALNITPEQRERLQAIRKDSMAKFRAILTPEQQAKLEQMRVQRFGGKQRPVR